MKLRIAICDDESILCEETKKIILEIHPEYELNTFFSGRELLETSLKYDLIFLDIEMQGQNGMDIARHLREQKYMGHIIFLTNYDEYMPEAFKVKAFRFLIKPLKMDDLVEIFENAEHEIFENQEIVVDGYGVEFLIPVRNIVYIQAVKKNTILYLKDKSIETPYSLKYWLEKLSENDFCQVHKSFIVSLRYIVKIDVNEVSLRGSSCNIPLSRRKKNIVKQAFFNYIGQHARVM